jgi:hypothetical protein
LRYEDIEPDQRVRMYGKAECAGVIRATSNSGFSVRYDNGRLAHYLRSHAHCFEPEGSFVDTRRGRVYFQNSEPESPPTKIPDSEPMGDEMPLADWERDLLFKETIEQEARRLVHGERDQTYDNPRGNFARIAKVWSGLLASKLKEDIVEEEVAIMMSGLKLARLMHRYQHRDGKVDAIGYVLCLDWLGEADAD